MNSWKRSEPPDADRDGDTAIVHAQQPRLMTQYEIEYVATHSDGDSQLTQHARDDTRPAPRTLPAPITSERLQPHRT